MGDSVDTYVKRDAELYHRDHSYHLGNYKAVNVWGRAGACSGEVRNLPSESGLGDNGFIADDPTSSPTRRGEHWDTASEQGADCGDDSTDGFREDADPSDVLAHPFDLPPEECELDGLYDGRLPTDTQRASSSRDSCPEARHDSIGPTEPRRRLTGKTNPSRAAELGHLPLAAEPQSERELVTREVARAARLRQREAAEAHSRASKVARTSAWLAIRRQPEVAAGNRYEVPTDQVAVDGVATPAVCTDNCDIPLRWMAHTSHDISAAPGAHIIFCKRCGAWSLGERSTNLTRPCTMKAGHKGNLRLLSLGIAPRRGARVPAELKKAGARGTRGGFVVRRCSKRRGGR